MGVGALNSGGEHLGVADAGLLDGPDKPPAVVLDKDHVLHVRHHDLAVKVHIHRRCGTSALDDAVAVLLSEERGNRGRAVRANQQVLSRDQGIGGIETAVAVGIAGWIRTRAWNTVK